VATEHQDDLDQALKTLELTLPVTREQLAAKRRELLCAWHPARCANLTNNPKTYSRTFKQAEEMTSRIEAACRVVNEWLAAQKADG